MEMLRRHRKKRKCWKNCKELIPNLEKKLTRSERKHFKKNEIFIASLFEENHPRKIPSLIGIF